MTTKKINLLREETYNNINDFRNADIITDKQYEILRKRYNINEKVFNYRKNGIRTHDII